MKEIYVFGGMDSQKTPQIHVLCAAAQKLLWREPTHGCAEMCMDHLNPIGSKRRTLPGAVCLVVFF